MTDPLSKLRKKIDRSDRQLLKALAARMQIVQEVGKIKKVMGLSIEQKARWSQVIDECEEQGAALGLRPRFVRALYSLIHRESLKVQKLKAQKIGPIKGKKINDVDS